MGEGKRVIKEVTSEKSRERSVDRATFLQSTLSLLQWLLFPSPEEAPRACRRMVSGCTVGTNWDRHDYSQLQEMHISTFTYCSSDDSSVGKSRFLFNHSFIHSLIKDSLSTYCAPGSVLSSEAKAEDKTGQFSACLVFTLWYGR